MAERMEFVKADYESHCRGQSAHLRRTLSAWRRSGLSNTTIAGLLVASIPHINHDGAMWLIEDLIGLEGGT